MPVCRAAYMMAVHVGPNVGHALWRSAGGRPAGSLAVCQIIRLARVCSMALQASATGRPRA